jgi:hypothetical protein
MGRSGWRKPPDPLLLAPVWPNDSFRSFVSTCAHTAPLLPWLGFGAATGSGRPCDVYGSAQVMSTRPTGDKRSTAGSRTVALSMRGVDPAKCAAPRKRTTSVGDVVSPPRADGANAIGWPWASTMRSLSFWYAASMSGYAGTFTPSTVSAM